MRDASSGHANGRTARSGDGQRNGAGFEVRPEPWRVLRLYFWVAFALAAGPLLFGLWSGVMGYLLTQLTLREVLERCFELVGYGPLLGLILVLISVPAGWVLFGVHRRQGWRIDDDGIIVLDGTAELRRIAWAEIDTVRVGVNGPLIILKDRSQEGESLAFVRREASVRLHRAWTEHRS